MIIFLLMAVAVIAIVILATQGALDALQELDKPKTDYPRRDPWRVGKDK